MLSFRQQIFDAVRTFEWVTTHMKILNIPSTAYSALFSNVRSNFFCFWKLGALPSPKIVISFAYFIWIINQYSRREILNSEMLPFVDLTCNKIATNAGKNLIHVSFSTQLLYPLLAYSLTYSIVTTHCLLAYIITNGIAFTSVSFYQIKYYTTWLLSCCIFHLIKWNVSERTLTCWF